MARGHTCVEITRCISAIESQLLDDDLRMFEKKLSSFGMEKHQYPAQRGWLPECSLLIPWEFDFGTMQDVLLMTT